MPPLTDASSYLSQSKEDLSLAYVRAVAAAADCFVEMRSRDVHGIDGTIYQYNSVGQFPGQGLEFQAKCTEVSRIRDGRVVYDLRVSNYNRLCSPLSAFPAILILLVVPTDVRRWVDHTEQHLLVRQSAYWAEYRTQLPSANLKTKRVTLNRINALSVIELVRIMDLVTADQF